MTNWKSYVEKKNAETFVLPDGWDSQEDVAKDLDCAPEKVNDHLRPGISSGEIERKQFPVWNSHLGRKVLVWAYKKAEPKIAPTKEQVSKLREAGKSWPECGRALGISADRCRRLAGAK